MKKNKILFTLLVFFCVYSDTYAQQKNVISNYFIDIDAIDNKTKPQEDFYKFANGTWLNTQIIKSDEQMTAPYIDLYKANEVYIDSIIISLSNKTSAKSTDVKNLSNFYKSGQIVSKNGSEIYLKKYFDNIDKIRDIASISKFCADNVFEPTKSLISISATDNNNGRYIATLNPSGLNLPVNIYTNADKYTLLKSYEYYIETTLKQIGIEDEKAREMAILIISIEKNIANSLSTNQKNNSNVISFEQLKEFKKVNLETFFTSLSLNPKNIKISDNRYLTALDSLMSIYPLDAWKAKLKIDYIIYNSKKLDLNYQQAFSSFFEEKLSGKKNETREQYLANFIKNNLKEILGIIYIENKFSKASKQDIEYLFLKLKNVFGKQIENNKWLNANTKKIAIEKLDKMLANIGYPNSWNPYTAINFDSTDFFRNTSLIYRIGKEANLKLIDKGIDKSIWTFPVYGIGQSYNTNMNTFTIVSGFLQSPFYSKTMDDAVIYGSIATTIGHEMAHGFDNNGHLYDANGIKVNWWTDSDSLNFVKATQPLVEQFNNVVVLDSIHINGNLTLGENIADLVGLTIAYQAFTSTATFKSNKLVNGYTPMQRFFIAYAQRAKEKLSNEAIKWQTTQVWAPQNVRINETLKNFKPFQQAFKVKIGKKMYQSEQFKVY